MLEKFAKEVKDHYSEEWLDIYYRSNSMLCYAKSLQSCLTLCDPIDSSPPGSPVPGILQARTLEWVAISFSNAWKWKVKVKSLSRLRLLVTPWTAAYQAPLSMDFLGKSTGVGCHFLLRYMKVESESEVAQSSPTLSDPMDCSLSGSLYMGFSRQEYWSGFPFFFPNS